MVVRGFFQDVKLEELKKDEKTPSFIKQEIARGNRIGTGITIFFFIITVLFLYLLYHYLNIWAAVATLLLIFSRIPDLVWEIRNGKKVTKNNRPKGGLYLITDITILISLPILWWSLYNL